MTSHQYKRLTYADAIQLKDRDGKIFCGYFISQSIFEDKAIICAWKPDWKDIICLVGRYPRKVDDFIYHLKDQSILRNRSTNQLDLYFAPTDWGFAILDIGWIESFKTLDLPLKIILQELENEVK